MEKILTLKNQIFYTAFRHEKWPLFEYWLDECSDQFFATGEGMNNILLVIYRRVQLLQSIEMTALLDLLCLPLLTDLKLKGLLRSRGNNTWSQGQYNMHFLQTFSPDELTITEEDVSCLMDRIPSLMQNLYLNRCWLPGSKSPRVIWSDAGNQ